jgi:hypothetical protein
METAEFPASNKHAERNDRATKSTTYVKPKQILLLTAKMSKVHRPLTSQNQYPTVEARYPFVNAFQLLQTSEI